MADFRRNRWPGCVGISGRLASDYAIWPAAPIKRLAGVGHYCFEDTPQEIAGLITEFIRQT
ncbi:alpha/beta fold hydrolase [Bradyrhizobium sp. USDA 3364]